MSKGEGGGGGREGAVEGRLAIIVCAPSAGGELDSFISQKDTLTAEQNGTDTAL